MRTFGIVVLVVVVLLSVGLAFVRGLSRPDVALGRAPAFAVAGRSFAGAADSDTLARLFAEVKALHEAGRLPGTLAAVYAEPAADTLRVWVGAVVPDTAAALPPGYLYRRFPSTEVVRATTNAHYMLAPTPDKLKARLIEFAAARRRTPGPYVLEKYLNEREIVMELPVTPNP